MLERVVSSARTHVQTYRFLNASCSSCCLVRTTALSELRCSAAAEGEFMVFGEFYVSLWNQLLSLCFSIIFCESLSL